MEKIKTKLHYLKTKILNHNEIFDNIKLELSNEIFEIERELTKHYENTRD